MSGNIAYKIEYTYEDEKAGDEEANPDTGDYGNILMKKKKLSIYIFYEYDFAAEVKWATNLHVAAKAM